MKHPLLVDQTLVTYHRMWKDFNLYSNFYDIDRYPGEGNKVSQRFRSTTCSRLASSDRLSQNDTAILYVDDPNFDVHQCLARMKDPPPVLGIVQVVPDEGFR